MGNDVRTLVQVAISEPLKLEKIESQINKHDGRCQAKEAIGTQRKESAPGIEEANCCWEIKDKC
jgi:hypothetical protein